MTDVNSIGQVIEGLKRIRDEIIDRVRARGVRISRGNFKWNGGELSFSVLRDPIRMEVSTGPCRAGIDWPLEAVQDCWDRIDRPEVLNQIEIVVNTLVPQR